VGRLSGSPPGPGGAFTVAFARDLPFGRCVAVSLPAEDAPDGAGGLHPDETAYARGLPPARRVTFVGGRLALRAALADLGVAATAPITVGARGAPALPPGVAGSISHKTAVAVALAARAQGTDAGVTLGIDVELAARAPRPGVARRVLGDGELRRLEALDPAERGVALLVAFSAKEALYKALDPWVARRVSFQEVAIARDAAGGLTATLDLARGEGPFAVELHEEPAPGLVLVAARVRRLVQRGP
jgi:4'-phosphopantetheinyl transferase EntD